MPGRSIIIELGLGGGLGALFEHHPTAARVLVLAAVFVFGYLYAFVIGRRDLACYNWFWVLAVVTIWIGYPLTTVRICLAAVVFVLGLSLLTIYYRSHPPRS